MPSLISTGIAVSILSAMSITYGNVKMSEWRESLGKTQGQQLDTLGAAVDAYVATNFRELVGQTTTGTMVGENGSAGMVAAALAPTVAELKTLGYLKANFNATNTYGGGYRVDLAKIGSCGSGAYACSIGGTTSTSAGIMFRGVPDITALAAALKELGADGGFSKSASPGTISGISAAWSATNPVGATAGVLAVRIGTDAARFNTSYRRDGGLPLTAALQMGGNKITGILAVDMTTNPTCTTKGDLAQDSTTGAPVYCNGTPGTYKAIGGATAATWVANYSALTATVTCNTAAKGQTYVVTTPTVGTGPRAYTCDGTAWQALAVNDSGALVVDGLLTVGKADGTSGGLNIRRVATVGDSCNAAVDGNVAQDSTGMLLTCQSGKWASVGGGTTKVCGVGLTSGEIPVYCTSVGQTVYASSTSATTVIGKYAGSNLIAATSDQSSGAQWGYYGTTTGATSTSDGAANTSIIASGSPAAQACTSLGVGWFLPAHDQLQLLYNGRATIGGFSTGYYWSSTETTSYYAWYLYFNNGSWNNDTKYSYGGYVRCVRSF